MQTQGTPTSALTIRKLKAKDAAAQTRDLEKEVVILTKGRPGDKTKATVRIFLHNDIPPTGR
jgi:hypothetical protein